ncbi:hypothetical protein [Natronococcus wangiae]|uniref:hypothetical protein n=1 Tax=Natronococcus wangiae TaxID=3068275 RepID=UPI00273E82BB|nr:hypothetical protein [Natronococcus sp. AD5]
MRKITAGLLALTLILAVAGTFSIAGLAHEEPNDDHEECAEMMENDAPDDCPMADGGMMGGMMDSEMEEDCPMEGNEMMADGMMNESETGCH